MKRKKTISKDIFDKEILMCKRLFKEKKGKCAWGKCKDCGVIPLLYKLHKGELLEKPLEINKVKNKILR